MKWVTRERPVIDRIACPWLIAKFIDSNPSFFSCHQIRLVVSPQRQGPSPTTYLGSSFRMWVKAAALIVL